MTTIFAPPSNASKWQMGFNSAFKGLIKKYLQLIVIVTSRALLIPTINNGGYEKFLILRFPRSETKLI